MTYGVIKVVCIYMSDRYGVYEGGEGGRDWEQGVRSG